jgi:integrase/recombinase XerD
MNKLKKILADYIALRRSLGFEMTKHDIALREFLKFFMAQKAQYLTIKLALQWARKPQDTNPAWWTDRLSMLRGFAGYWKTIDPRTEVPPVHLLLPWYKRPMPHIYTEEQIDQILKATQRLSPPHNFIYWTLFGLLTATGIRIGEALALNNEDVDLKQGLITIREAKCHKSRILPVDCTTKHVLQRYTQQRNRWFQAPKASSFFVAMDGRRPSHYCAWRRFGRIIAQLRIESPSTKCAPRLHDLRHTFAVRSLISFYQSGQNIDRKIHALSIYLGHKGIACTYWYLTAVPELMSMALAKLEEKIGGV